MKSKDLEAQATRCDTIRRDAEATRDDASLSMQERLQAAYTALDANQRAAQFRAMVTERIDEAKK